MSTIRTPFSGPLKLLLLGLGLGSPALGTPVAWVPNRPPREQKSPLASGTWKLEMTIGCASMVTSTNHAICRGS